MVDHKSDHGFIAVDEIPQADVDLPVHTYWNPNKFKFIRSYQADLDVEKALKASGMNEKELAKAKKDATFEKALLDIEKAHYNALELNNTTAAGEFIGLYKLLKQRLIAGDNALAAPVVSMAATYLKATGHMDKDSDKSKVHVTIDISTDMNKPVYEVTNSKNNEYDEE